MGVICPGKMVSMVTDKAAIAADKSSIASSR